MGPHLPKSDAGPISDGGDMAALVGETRTMSSEDVQILERYRTLLKRVDDQNSQVQKLKAQIRDQLEKVNQLDVAGRQARSRYQSISARQGVGGREGDTSGVDAGKHEVATTAADLVEASTLLCGLEADLRKMQSGAPDAVEIDGARRAAWEVIARDLQAQIPEGLDELIGKVFAATLEFRPQASFSVALASVCPVELRREQCPPLLEQLAQEYSIPLPKTTRVRVAVAQT